MGSSLELLKLLDEQERRKKYNYINTLFPDEGKFKRSLYQKHLDFFKAGAVSKERLFMAGNRVGKTLAGGSEIVYHATGNYPDWWEGYRYTKPVKILAAGDTAATTRDIIQDKLIGEISDIGTGLLPADSILDTVPKRGVANAQEMILVKSKFGISTILLRSYDQGRRVFQGFEADIVWLDEEVPKPVYDEALIRLMTTQGLLMMTYTPINGLTELTSSFLSNQAENDHREVITAGWDDVPHLDDAEKEKMKKSLTPNQIDARSKGIPSMGAGSIYPVTEEDIKCDPFELPTHWPKAYALDVGWNKTAAIWGAFDQDTRTWYLYSEHYRGKAEPSIHADAIKSRGDWIQGAIDPAARGRSQIDGEKLIEIYGDLGLDLVIAKNSVNAGIEQCFQGLSTAKIKVFSTLTNFFEEYRIYRRDENGKIVKKNDHLMDAFRYLIMTGEDIAQTESRSTYSQRSTDWRSF